MILRYADRVHLCFFMGLRTNSEYFDMKHRLTDLFITRSGLVYCAVRSEYSIFWYFHASPVSYCLLLWRRQRVKALSCLCRYMCENCYSRTKSDNRFHSARRYRLSCLSVFTVSCFVQAADQHVRFSISKAPYNI